jgi:hypothetical protein
MDSLSERVRNGVCVTWLDDDHFLYEFEESCQAISSDIMCMFLAKPIYISLPFDWLFLQQQHLHRVEYESINQCI